MDPRAAQTRSLLHGAVLELAAEQPLDDISITRLTTLAGVNRSSFYQHFRSVEELLASALETSADSAGRLSGPVEVTDPGTPPQELTRFLAHFAEHAAVYRHALGPEGSALVAARVRARVVELVLDGIELSERRLTDLPLDIEAAGTAGALLGAIEAWLHRDPLPSPATAASWLWRILIHDPAALAAGS